MRIAQTIPAASFAALLVACAPQGQPTGITAFPSEAGVGPQAPVTAGPKATGTVTMTIKWPDRPDYATQVIPLRTNSLVLQIRNASGSLVAETTVVRPNGGSLVTTASLDAPAGTGQRIDVKAYTEQTPGFDSLPIAQGSALNVAIAPSTQQSLRITLVPTAGPVVTGFPANAGPLSYVTIEGSNFDGWGGEVKVYFGGVPSPYVTGSSTQLTAQVPSNALNGPISVQADGVTATSSGSCLIIRALGLSPEAATTSVGAPVDYTATARDASGSLIPSPALTWSFMATGPAPLPGSSPPPPTTLINGRFTPGSTGSYELRISAGNILATTSLIVE